MVTDFIYMQTQWSSMTDFSGTSTSEERYESLIPHIDLSILKCIAEFACL